MPNEIISYLEMCRRENASLQRGMNFGLAKNHSVILMSVRRGAPYRDYVDGDGSLLLYEGHDEPKSVSNPNPKQIDQSDRTLGGIPERIPAACPCSCFREANARNLVLQGHISPNRRWEGTRWKTGCVPVQACRC